MSAIHFSGQEGAKSGIMAVSQLTCLEENMPKTMTPEEKDARRIRNREWRARAAIAAGREPGKLGAPKQFTDDELREKRRVKDEAWRAAHLDRAREINRESARRTAAARAIAAGREPGRRPRKVAPSC